MWITLTLAAALVAIAVGLALWQWKVWRTADHGGLGQREEAFLRNQFHRRQKASAMLGIAGLLLLGELWISDRLMLLLYWCGVSLLVLWILLLSLIDWLASRQYYGNLAAESQTEHALLKAEIERHRRNAGPPTS